MRQPDWCPQAVSSFVQGSWERGRASLMSYSCPIVGVRRSNLGWTTCWHPDPWCFISVAAAEGITLHCRQGAPAAARYTRGWPAAQDAEGWVAGLQRRSGRKLCLHLSEYICPGVAAITILSGTSDGYKVASWHPMCLVLTQALSVF